MELGLLFIGHCHILDMVSRNAANKNQAALTGESQETPDCKCQALDALGSWGPKPRRPNPWSMGKKENRCLKPRRLCVVEGDMNTWLNGWVTRMRKIPGSFTELFVQLDATGNSGLRTGLCFVYYGKKLTEWLEHVLSYRQPWPGTVCWEGYYFSSSSFSKDANW